MNIVFTTLSVNDIVNTLKEYYDLIDGYLAIIFFIWSIIQFFYYNKLNVYIFVTKFFRKWRDTDWELTFTCNIDKDKDAFKDVENVIKEIYRVQTIRKEMNLSNSKIYSLNSFLLKVSCDDFDNNNKREVFIEIPKLKTTYSHANELLDEIEILFKKISAIFRAEDEVYTINIRFKNGKNPFLGFMLQRLGQDSVNHFRCEINTNAFMRNSTNLYNQKATIYKDYLNVTQKSFIDLKEISSSLLLLK